MRMWKRIHASGLVIAFVASGLLGSSVLANSAQAEARQFVSFTVTLTSKSGSQLQLQNKNAVEDIIYCGGTVSYPYVSGGRVRVDVEASCSDVVDTIEVGAALAAGSILVDQQFASAGPAIGNGVQASSPCPGYSVAWAGAGAARFTKAGYANSPLVLSGQTPYVNITC